MTPKQTLKQLGYSDKEIQVYLALLKLGLTQTGPILKATKLHGVIVYNALDKLVDDGLASVTRKKNIKMFQALDPSVIAEKTKRLHQNVQAMIPDLRKLQADVNNAVSVRTLVGEEGFQTNLQDVVASAMKQKDKVMRIIGGAKDTEFYETIGEWYPKYVDLLQKSKVKKHLLAPEFYSSEFKEKFEAEPGNTLLTLPKGLSSPTYTRITNEMVTIEIYRPSVIVIQIRNKAIAQSYLESFEIAWNQLKK